MTLFFGLCACSLKNSSSKNVNLKLKFGGKSKSHKAFAKSEPSLPEELFSLAVPDDLPATVAGFSCLAVNIMGTGIRSAFPHDGSQPWDTYLPALISSSVGDACSYPGKTSSFLGAAGSATVNLEVTSGPNRYIQVVGVNTTFGCPNQPLSDYLSTHDADSDDDGITGLYELGHAVTDLLFDQTITIANAYNPNAPRRLDCGDEKYFLYALMSHTTAGQSEIRIYEVDERTGELTDAGTEVLASTLHTPHSLANSPDGNYLYVGDGKQTGCVGSASQILVYSINPSTGDLTELPAEAEALGMDFCVRDLAIAETASGDFLYAVAGKTTATGGGIYGFVIGNDGSLTPTPAPSIIPATNCVSNDFMSISVTPDGSTVNAVCKGNAKVYSFSTQANGDLAAWLDVPTSQTLPVSVASGSIGGANYTLVASLEAAGLGVVTNHAAGLLTLGTEINSFAALDVPKTVLIHPTGEFAYLASQNVDRLIEAYSVNSVSAPVGELTPLNAINPIETNDGPMVDAAFDPTGRFLFTLSRENASSQPQIHTFQIDFSPGNQGELIGPLTTPENTGNIAGAFTPTAIIVVPGGH